MSLAFAPSIEVTSLQWTSNPGLASSTAELCDALGHHADSAAIYAIVVACRGPSSRVCSALAETLLRIETSQPALLTLAQASASAALMTCADPDRSKELASDFRSLFAGRTRASIGEQEARAEGKEHAFARDCEATGALPVTAVLGLVGIGLRRRGMGPLPLAAKLESYLDASGVNLDAQLSEAADFETKIFKSVRSL